MYVESFSFLSAPAPGSYWLLDTDYTSFASVYSCDEFAGNKLEYGWLLTREPLADQQTVIEIFFPL